MADAGDMSQESIRKLAKSSAQHKDKTLTIGKEHFNQWYEQVLNQAEIIYNGYPVTGMMVYLPNGFHIHNSIMQSIRNEWAKLGIEQTLFPAAIPYSLLATEADHIKGFDDSCFWVTRTGLEELPEDQKLALRPTSETAIYSCFAAWIHSFRDLPMRVHQQCCVYRYETKHTRPLIRVREIPWDEAHTAHATAEEAQEMLRNAWRGYLNVIEEQLCYTGLYIRRPYWDQFPGGEHSEVMDTIMPNGRVLQTVGAHYLGQKFARVFDIRFQTKENTFEYAYMTCFGVSCRLMAAALATHGDNYGLIVPPHAARYQCVVLPMGVKKNQTVETSPALAEAHRIADALNAAGIRALLDDDNSRTVGERIYGHDLRGVPTRIEIGPRDLENGHAVIVRRDLPVNDPCKKRTVELASIVDEMKAELETVRLALRERAFKFHEDHLRVIMEDDEELSTVKSALLDSHCVCKVPFFIDCSEHQNLYLHKFVEPKLSSRLTPEAREAAIEKARQEFDAQEAPKRAILEKAQAIYQRARDIEAERLRVFGAEIRGFPLDETDVPPPGSKCLLTGEPAKAFVYIARCY